MKIHLLRHIRYVIRQLSKSPGFTIIAILILSLGIGANTAIFSLIDAVLLKPLPLPRPGQLVRVFEPLRNLDRSPLPAPLRGAATRVLLSKGSLTLTPG
jgi:putative ABC transport system permease protein